MPSFAEGISISIPSIYGILLTFTGNSTVERPATFVGLNEAFPDDSRYSVKKITEFQSCMLNLTR